MTIDNTSLPPSKDAPTILIIDDDSDQRLMLECIVKQGGFQTLCASSAEEGSEMINQNSIDLIVCDLMLPAVSGLELAKQIGNLPFVLVSAGEPTSAEDLINHKKISFCHKSEARKHLIPSILSLLGSCSE